MVTVVTKTIGPSGRDYSTFTLAEAAVETIATSAFGGTNLVTADGAIVFEADAATYAESLTFSSSLTTDATRNVTYKAAAGSEHGGVRGAGVNLEDSSTAYGSVLRVRDSFMVLDGLCVQATNDSAGSHTACDLVPNGSDLEGIQLRGLILSTGSFRQVLGSFSGYSFGSVSAPLVVENCVLHRDHAATAVSFPVTGTDVSYAEFINVTCTGVLTGSRFFNSFVDTSASIHVSFVNCLNLVQSSVRFIGSGSSTVTGSNNFGGSSEAFPAAIQGSPYPIVPTTNTSPGAGAGNFAIYVASTGQLVDSGDNAVLDQGVGPSANADVPTQGILGGTRSGSTAHPGAFALLYLVPASLGSLTGSLGPDGPVAFPARVAGHYVKASPANYGIGDGLELNDVPATSAAYGQFTNNVPSFPALPSFPAGKEDRLSPAFDFFERFLVRPSSFVLGNVVATQQIAVVIYSAYRRSAHTWNSFSTNAGAGVDLINEPTLPTSIGPQVTISTASLEVLATGTPTVNSTLDFVFSTMTVSPVISLTRVILWSPRPNLPYQERLAFNTQIIPHTDGTEQRIALRPNARQSFDWKHTLDGGSERAAIHNLLFEWQSRVYGIPMYHEGTRSTSAITAGDTTINVRSTDYADYREGGLAVIYDTASGATDVLEIATSGIAATTLTFTAGAANAYSAGVLVAPVRTARTRPQISGARFPTDVATIKMSFDVLDNESNIASTAAWTTTHNSKVVVDDENAVSASMAEQFLRPIVVLDNDIGAAFFDSPQDKGKRSSVKTFHAASPQKAWEVRQLLYALRGRQVSFYLPTFGKDFTPTSPLTVGDTTLTVENVGYSAYVDDRRPYTVIRVHFTDPVANPPLIRTITASAAIDAATETVTVDAPWPATYAVSDVKRIEYLEQVRLDSDSIRIRHAEGDTTVRVTCPVITVFD